MSAKCIVCGKDVAHTDQAEHLATNHLGPHYFWFDGRRVKSDSPSATMAKIKAMANVSSGYQAFVEVADGSDRAIGDGEAVCLTGEPHFFAVPPATMWG